MVLGNLLIVDDEELLVKNISYLLKKHTEKIHVAYNGLDALSVVENNQIHCVICDISMPKMNGLEFMQKVREAGNEVPFIFFTAYGQSELMLKAAEYGAFDFVRKPDFGNLEESVLRGISEGFKRLSDNSTSANKQSEYDKILNELNKII